MQSNFSYLIKEGLRNIYANKMMSLASIGVLIACLLLIGSSLLLTVNVNEFVGFIESQNEIVVFIFDSYTLEDLEGLDAQMRALENISDVQFISKEDGLREWITGLGDTAEEGLFDALVYDNVMPHSYRVKVKDLEFLSETIDQIYDFSQVESVSAPVEVAQTVLAIRKMINAASIGVISILALVALVIVGNTIRLTVFSRRKEIGIMKYVGATDFFIRMPFIVEGFMLGLISACVSFLILWGAYTALLSGMQGSQTGWLGLVLENMVPFNKIALKMFLGFSLSGIVIGMLGSNVFLRKYLKV